MANIWGGNSPIFLSLYSFTCSAVYIGNIWYGLTATNIEPV